MLPEELPVSYRHRQWCRWIARVLVVFMAIGCLITVSDTLGLAALLAALCLVAGLVVARTIFLRRLRAKIIDLGLDH